MHRGGWRLNNWNVRFGSLADIAEASINVRYYPKRGQFALSFEQFVCATGQWQWHGDAQCLGCLQVDVKLYLGGPLNRQVRRLITLKDTAKRDGRGPPLPVPRPGSRWRASPEAGRNFLGRV